MFADVLAHKKRMQMYANGQNAAYKSAGILRDTVFNKPVQAAVCGTSRHNCGRPGPQACIQGVWRGRHFPLRTTYTIPRTHGTMIRIARFRMTGYGRLQDTWPRTRGLIKYTFSLPAHPRRTGRQLHSSHKLPSTHAGHL
jgi:hypothetical protein